MFAVVKIFISQLFKNCRNVMMIVMRIDRFVENDCLCQSRVGLSYRQDCVMIDARFDGVSVDIVIDVVVWQRMLMN